MSWESRGGRRYYYAARKVGGRVVKDYLGCGPHADLGSRLAARARALRAARGEALAAARAVMAEPEAAAAALEAACRVALAAALTAAGYHRANYGPWRRRHGRRDAAR